MKRILLIFLAFVFMANLGHSQTEKQEDLKVGVVLSGGGAKGFAHIAVLKILEEVGVRVDYIGGTSMGAMVGGLYAAGYSADQLDSIVRTIDFNDILNDEVPRRAKSFVQKEIGEKYALTLPVQNNKVGLPAGLSEGQKVLNLFTELTQHVNDINDFSELPIPFLCVATDLETGEPVVMRSGFLPEAIKASGSFPSLLAPVEIDGRLLTDGGVVNNFPVDEVRAMGADIIIGVDIQGTLNEKEQLRSALSIIDQIVSFQMYEGLDKKHERVEVLIRPDMTNYGVVSFGSYIGILEEGEVATNLHLEELKEIASRQTKQVERIKPTKVDSKYLVKRIEVEGNENYTRAYILGTMNLKKRDSISYKRLLRSIDNLTATDNFKSVQYKIHKDNDGGSIVKIKVKESDINSYLKLGIHYDDLYQTGVLLNGTMNHAFSKNDFLSVDFILGDNVRYDINYFIDNGFYISTGLRSKYDAFDVDVNFSEGGINKINVDYGAFINQLFIQTVLSRMFTVGIGLEHQNVKISTKNIGEINGNQIEDNERFYFDKSDYLNLIAYAKIDTRDKKYFPSRGVNFDALMRHYMSSSDYNENFHSFTQLTAIGDVAFGFYDRKFVAHFFSEAGVTIGQNENRVLDYNVGGWGYDFINNFTPFFGYDYAELSADAYVKSGLTLRYQWLRNHYFSVAGNFARVESDLYNDGRLFENTKSGYLVGYGVDTFLGPLEINYTWSPDHSESYWYFNVGFWF